MSPSSSFVQTNRDFAATNEEEDDDDASNNWMRLINNRRDREKIARLRDADDPSLRAMFDAITTTLKQKDENVERAAAIGFERGVSFAAGPSSSSSFVNNATKKKKMKKNGTKRLENDSDSDDDSSDDDDYDDDYNSQASGAISDEWKDDGEHAHGTPPHHRERKSIVVGMLPTRGSHVDAAAAHHVRALDLDGARSRSLSPAAQASLRDEEKAEGTHAPQSNNGRSNGLRKSPSAVGFSPEVADNKQPSRRQIMAMKRQASSRRGVGGMM